MAMPVPVMAGRAGVMEGQGVREAGGAAGEAMDEVIAGGADVEDLIVCAEDSGDGGDRGCGGGGEGNVAEGSGRAGDGGLGVLGDGRAGALVGDEGEGGVRGGEEIGEGGSRDAEGKARVPGCW